MKQNICQVCFNQPQTIDLTSIILCQKCNKSVHKKCYNQFRQKFICDICADQTLSLKVCRICFRFGLRKKIPSQQKLFIHPKCLLLNQQVLVNSILKEKFVYPQCLKNIQKKQCKAQIIGSQNSNKTKIMLNFYEVLSLNWDNMFQKSDINKNFIKQILKQDFEKLISNKDNLIEFQQYIKCHFILQKIKYLNISFEINPKDLYVDTLIVILSNMNLDHCLNLQEETISKWKKYNNAKSGLSYIFQKFKKVLELNQINYVEQYFKHNIKIKRLIMQYKIEIISIKQFLKKINIIEEGIKPSYLNYLILYTKIATIQQYFQSNQIYLWYNQYSNYYQQIKQLYNSLDEQFKIEILRNFKEIENLISSFQPLEFFYHYYKILFWTRIISIEGQPERQLYIYFKIDQGMGKIKEISSQGQLYISSIIEQLGNDESIDPEKMNIFKNYLYLCQRIRWLNFELLGIKEKINLEMLLLELINIYFDRKIFDLESLKIGLNVIQQIMHKNISLKIYDIRILKLMKVIIKNISIAYFQSNNDLNIYKIIGIIKKSQLQLGQHSSKLMFFYGFIEQFDIQSLQSIFSDYHKTLNYYRQINTFISYFKEIDNPDIRRLFLLKNWLNITLIIHNQLYSQNNTKKIQYKLAEKIYFILLELHYPTEQVYEKLMELIIEENKYKDYIDHISQLEARISYEQLNKYVEQLSNAKFDFSHEICKRKYYLQQYENKKKLLGQSLNLKQLINLHNFFTKQTIIQSSSIINQLNKKIMQTEPRCKQQLSIYFESNFNMKQQSMFQNTRKAYQKFSQILSISEKQQIFRYQSEQFLQNIYSNLLEEDNIEKNIIKKWIQDYNRYMTSIQQAENIKQKESLIKLFYNNLKKIPIKNKYIFEEILQKK